MNITDSQQVALSVTAVDKKGNPVPNVGALAFSVSDEAILSLVDNGDGTAVVSAVGPLGDAVVTVQDDVDADTVPDFFGSLAVSVVAGSIAEISIVAGEPTEQA